MNNTLSQRMEKAFLTQCFILINDVQVPTKEFIPYRKTLWTPKTISSR